MTETSNKKRISDYICDNFSLIFPLELFFGIFIVLCFVISSYKISVTDAITIIFSYVLVTATIFYAWKTAESTKFTAENVHFTAQNAKFTEENARVAANTLSLMEQKQILDTEPFFERRIFKENVGVIGKDITDEVGDFFLYLRNIGKGPAKDIELYIISSTEHINKKIRHEYGKIHLNPLMHGEETWIRIRPQVSHINYNKIDDHIKGIGRNDYLFIYLFYKNVYNDNLATKQYIENFAMEHISAEIVNNLYGEECLIYCDLYQQTKKWTDEQIKCLNDNMERNRRSINK